MAPFMGVLGMYVHLCTNYRLLASTMWTRELYIYFANYFSPYWHVSLNIYGCQIANIGHNILILHGHTDLIMVHTCIKTKPTTPLFHLIAIYVVETNMPTKWHIYVIYLMGVYRDVHRCTTYEVPSINHAARNTRVPSYFANEITWLLQHLWHISVIYFMYGLNVLFTLQRTHIGKHIYIIYTSL